VSGPLANEALRAATSNHEFASRELARNRTLFERGFIGQARLQEAERALITAQSALDQARAQQSGNAQSGAETVTAAARVREATAARALTAAKLSQTRIVAPGNAKVVARNIELGEIAQPGRRLLALAPEGETRLVAQIDEKNLALLR
jgi:HlyD family secretion protein